MLNLKVVRFKYDKQISYGFVEKDVVLEVSGSPFKKDHFVTGRDFALDEVQLLAPVEPSKIIAVGLNYIDHAKELKMPLPEEPIIFFKPASSLIGHEEEIKIPNQSRRVDYEAELAFVVSKTAKYISADNAEEYIYGYTCANDVTARDLQEKDGQWTRAKSFDTFCPVGPWVVADKKPDELDIQLNLNRDVKQSSNTSQMIFSPKELLSFISSVMTLFPGDIVLTGTPAGVGQMKPNDKITVKIQSIGELSNTAV